MKHRKLRITVEGKQYEVTVDDITDGEGGHHGAPRGGGEHRSASPPPSAPPRAPAAAAGAAGQEDRVAPLGGVVTSVYVTEGAVVKAGDKVVEIEAMKQKNDVVAHRAGTVQNIKVKVGDAVESSQVLMSIV